MALTQRLDLRQSQSLVMTPQLQQAIKLLQLSNIELAAFVDKELAENPLLELAEEEGGDAHLDLERPAEAEAPLAPTDKVTEDAATGDAAGQALDLDQADLWAGERPPDAADTDAGWQIGSWGEPGGQAHQEGHAADWEDIASAPETLRDHLLRQVQTEIDDGATRLIASYLVDCLDEAGYLAVSVSEVALALGTTTDRVADALAQCQRFDPPGLFARSLRECLALQLAERDRLDPAMATMLDHLDLLAQRDHALLGRLCGLDRSDIIEMVGEIRALNPKPAERFAKSVAQTIVPDVIVTGDSAGGWAVRLNQETLPRLLVNRAYHAAVRRSARSQTDRHYLNDRLASANWLVKALDQRANTILRVATELIRQQGAFLDHGIGGLKPLILRDIADAIDMHESTISRVTSNKFIATPRGVFELKYFFTTALASTAGDGAHSAETVRHRIKSLIASETPDAVLSDDQIAAMLGEGGVEIARRTVAKYREGMSIPSSTRRRREKVLGL